MDRNLALEFVRVTEAAALSCARLMGRGDRNAADEAAVEAMRKAFDYLHVRGSVVIGEGERDEAPMLYIGEKVGSGDQNDPEVDIAVDPLEGTNLVATGAANAISVIAIGEKGMLLNAPDIYMEKIAVGPRARGVIDLRSTPADNLRRIAQKMGRPIGDLSVCILERPRHEALIKEVREVGARIKLIGDGDVSGALATAFDESGVDVLMGIGGAPEGVLAAAGLRCIGGDIQGRLRPRNDADVQRCHRMGVADVDKVFGIEELAGGDVMFAATGVTNGDFLKGVRFIGDAATTDSLVMRSKSGTIRYIRTEHHFDKKPNFGW